jgi:thymidylate kinase
MRILIFEGISGCGKTSVISEVRKMIGKDNKHDLVIDRFIHSRFVFDKMYNRKSSMFEYFWVLLALWILQAKVIFIDQDVDFCWRNCLKKNDFFAATKLDIALERFWYTVAFKQLPMDIIRVNATGLSIKEIAEEVYEKIK